MPRNSNSLPTNWLRGNVESPPSPIDTITPRGATTSSPLRSARSLPEASNITSNTPLFTAKGASASGCFAILMASSAPIARAHSSGLSVMSTATMRAAPARRKAPINKVPIGPQPVTKTCLPNTLPARWIACKPTDKGSANAASDKLKESLSGCACDASITKV